MLFSISGYCFDELTDWDEMIRFLRDELAEFEKRLEDAIRRDSIPTLAAQAEELIERLELKKTELLRLETAIQAQDNRIMQDGELLEDAVLPKEVISSQDDLRAEMFTAEKDFIDLKYAVYDFLSGLLKQ